MKNIAAFICFLIYFQSYAQDPAFTIGSQRISGVHDNPDAATFKIDKYNYVMYSKFHMAEGMVMHLEGFLEPDNSYYCSQDITVPHLPNEIAIYEGFAALNDKMVLFRSVFNKDSKKSVLYAHELDSKGMIMDAAGKEITSITAEKAMNSGNFTIETSSDRKSFVVLSEMPFVKETKEKFAVTVFDNTLKQVWTKEIESLYDSRRGPVNKPMLSNGGVVYVIKKVEGPKTGKFH